MAQYLNNSVLNCNWNAENFCIAICSISRAQLAPSTSYNRIIADRQTILKFVALFTKYMPINASMQFLVKLKCYYKMDF